MFELIRGSIMQLESYKTWQSLLPIYSKQSRWQQIWEVPGLVRLARLGDPKDSYGKGFQLQLQRQAAWCEYQRGVRVSTIILDSTESKQMA